MAIVYKDIGQLSQKSSVAGTEKIEVSDTEYITPSQIVSGKADLASPALTGTPTAPTAAAGTNTTQIATTAFVQSAISGVGGLPSVTSSDFGKLLYVDYDSTNGYHWVKNSPFRFGSYRLLGETNWGMTVTDSAGSHIDIIGGSIECVSEDSTGHSPWSWIRSTYYDGTTYHDTDLQSYLDSIALPSVSTFGQFIESYYDTTSQTYKWHVSRNVYINSAAALQNDLSGGFLGTIYVTKAGPRSNTEFQFDNRGLVAEAWANNAVFSDWSWIKYRSSYSPSAYVTLQDYLDTHCLPEPTSADYGCIPFVGYDTPLYHWKKSDYRINSGVLESGDYGGFRAYGSSWHVELTYNGLYHSDASDWGWIKIPGNGQTYTTLQDTLDLKAPLASPALTGVPTAPTAASGTNTTQIATTAFVQAAVSGGGGGSTTDCVHKTGDESIAGDKTFTDDIVVGDASNIKYGASAGSGFTRGETTTYMDDSSHALSFEVEGEPKAFVLSCHDAPFNYDTFGVLMVVGDSTGVHGIYNTGSQHNYSASFTKSYSNGTLTVTAPTGVDFGDIIYSLVYYYGEGTLAFNTAQVTPGSGVTSVTFTGTGLTEVPEMYATFLETAVNNESYRRVAGYTNSAYSGSADVAKGITFLTGGPTNTTSSFTVSYNNGLVINSGGTNAGGYFHNPGTYTLYYLMASDIGGGGGSYQSLSAELSAITTSVSAKEATSNKVTSLSAQSTDTQYPSAKLVYDQLALKQGAITISSSEPTAYQGNNGDIWIVI